VDATPNIGEFSARISARLLPGGKSEQMNEMDKICPPKILDVQYGDESY